MVTTTRRRRTRKKVEAPILYPYNFIGQYLKRVEKELRLGSVEALCWVRSNDFTDFMEAWSFSIDLNAEYWRRKLLESWNYSRPNSSSDYSLVSPADSASTSSSPCYWVRVEARTE